METKSVSFMKWQQDKMSEPPTDATINTLVSRAIEVGFTHGEMTIPFGLSNTVSEAQRWVNIMRSKGLKKSWRMDDPSKHPMYNQPIAIGPNALPAATYYDRVDKFIRDNPNLFDDDDEWNIYYESTTYWQGDGKVVHIFNPAISWLTPNTKENFAAFFSGLIDVSKAAFLAINKKVQVGFFSVNGSEYLNKWIPQSLVDKMGYVVTDHYVDGNPTQLEADLRKMFADYGKPIYLQETAPHRSIKPDAAARKAYIDALRRLEKDGVLKRINYWGMWVGTAEGLLNADFTLNEMGLDLKAFFAETPTPVPTPTPTPIDLKPILDAIKDLKLAIDSRVTLEKAEAIIYGPGTLSVRMSKLKELIPNI